MIPQVISTQNWTLRLSIKAHRFCGDVSLPHSLSCSVLVFLWWPDAFLFDSIFISCHCDVDTVNVEGISPFLLVHLVASFLYHASEQLPSNSSETCSTSIHICCCSSTSFKTHYSFLISHLIAAGKHQNILDRPEFYGFEFKMFSTLQLPLLSKVYLPFLTCIVEMRHLSVQQKSCCDPDDQTVFRKNSIPKARFLDDQEGIGDSTCAGTCKSAIWKAFTYLVQHKAVRMLQRAGTPV